MVLKCHKVNHFNTLTSWPENKISCFVTFPGLYQSKVAPDGFFHDIMSAVKLLNLDQTIKGQEFRYMYVSFFWGWKNGKKHKVLTASPHLSALTCNSNAAISVVFYGWPPLLDESAIPGGSKKCWDACTASPYPLC